MEALNKDLKFTRIILFIVANLLLISCGTYQSIYNDDGIYGDETYRQEKEQVVILDEKETTTYEDIILQKNLKH
mgnify:FL=1